MIIIGIIYFIPALIAVLESRKNTGAIVAINILLGWTFIGWIIAFIWALVKDNETKNPPKQVIVKPEISEEIKQCPFCAETIKKAAMVCRFCNRDLIDKKAEVINSSNIYKSPTIESQNTKMQPIDKKNAMNNEILFKIMEFVLRKDTESKANGISSVGVYTDLYQNGQKKAECIINPDKSEGRYSDWHENGQTKTECTFRNGVVIHTRSWSIEGLEV